MIKNLFFNYQLRSYVRKLFYYIARDIGVRDRYKIKRIDQMIKKYRFNARYSYIAYAIFLDEKNFVKAKKNKRFNENREDIREFIANKYFSSNTKFTNKDLFRVSVYKNWHGIFNGDLCVIDYAAYNQWKNHTSGVGGGVDSSDFNIGP